MKAVEGPWKHMNPAVAHPKPLEECGGHVRCCKEAEFFGCEGDLRRLRDFIGGEVVTGGCVGGFVEA